MKKFSEFLNEIKNWHNSAPKQWYRGSDHKNSEDAVGSKIPVHITSNPVTASGYGRYVYKTTNKIHKSKLEHDPTYGPDNHHSSALYHGKIKLKLHKDMGRSYQKRDPEHEKEFLDRKSKSVV